jgi:hypothetical protein
MNRSEIEKLNAASDAAMLRAAKRASEIARETGTKLIIMRDGKVVALTAEELDKEEQENASQS